MTNYDVFVGGDFNVNFKIPDDPKTTQVVQMSRVYKLDILIDKCTIPNEGAHGGTVIDNILCNADNIISHKVLTALIRDHLPIACVQKKARNVNFVSEFQGRSYKNYDCDDLTDWLLYHDWSAFYKE